MKTERKKRDKKHLKGRILRSISLILICSMILSTLIGYLYFNQVVRKQRLEEEKNRLMQVGSQIAFQAEDNRRFAQSILVDEQLQYLLEGYGSDNPAAKSQGIKQLMAGGGVVLIGLQLIPLLSGLFS